MRLVTEVPAPTFAEEARAALVAELWRETGLAVRSDGVGNVIADVPGGTGPRVVLAAHLDTVFDRETDVSVREVDGGRWAAPGIGDNSASLAVLTAAVERLLADARSPRPRLRIAATVGEEGLGDLRGAKALVAGEHDIDAFVAVDGHLGTVVHEGVGSRRFEAVFTGPGGHSWGDRGTPSAIHAAGDAVHAVTRVRLPSVPKSSLGVGVISGGTAVNAIAAEARFTLDIRSVDGDVLATLEEEAVGRVRSVARRHGVAVDVRSVGARPASRGLGNAGLQAAARAALATIGVDAVLTASSTDANAAMGVGIPAICFGVYRGGDAHRASEWIDPASLDDGVEVLLALVQALAGA
ncbi:MAG: M20/M25/M40 family metallo-hydrolase [Trueperaceae bacterium]|nr:M20/M25/M40 family metallo-hydrolase [Trueperaceae bacterium]